MNEQQWLSSNDPAAMLKLIIGNDANVAEGLGGHIIATDRKLRLLASACSEVCDCPNIRPSDWFRYLQNPNYGWESDCKATKAAPFLLRLIFGNPFRLGGRGDTGFARGPLKRMHEWLTPDVLAVAQGIYDHRDASGFGELWDALETASCDSEEIRRALAWKQRCGKCLGEGAHGGGSEGLGIIGCLPCDCIGWLPIPGEPVMVRGFWVMDLILGKE